MRKELFFVPIVILMISALIQKPVYASESGRRASAYVMGLITAGAIYSKNPYAIGASTLGLGYTMKRLDDEIKSRRQRQMYQQTYAQPSNQCLCSNCCQGGYNGGYSGQPTQAVYYTTDSGGYEGGGSALEPSHAYDRNYSNYSIGYSGGRPNFRYSSRNSYGTTYSRPRRQIQPKYEITIIHVR